MSNYIDHLKNLEYPDYAQQSDDLDREELLDLSYNVGKLSQLDIPKIIEQNENSMSVYKQAQDPELIGLISDYLDIEPQKILITAGGDGGLNIVSRALVQINTRVAIPLPSFGRFEYHAKINQAEIDFVLPGEFPFDIDLNAVAEFVQQKSSEVIFLANPNNPTGMLKTKNEIEDLLSKIDGYLVLDEAMIDYTEEAALSLIDKYPKLVIVRSFSKFFGLSGMRVGYIVANELLIESLKKLVSPFETSHLSILMAKGVLKNYRLLKEQTRQDLDALRAEVDNYQDHSFSITPTRASIYLIKSTAVPDLYESLLEKGVKTVPGCHFRGLESQNCVRISVADLLSLKTLLGIMSTILAERS